jgi:hypothetical protein
MAKIILEKGKNKFSLELVSDGWEVWKQNPISHGWQIWKVYGNWTLNQTELDNFINERLKIGYITKNTD